MSSHEPHAILAASPALVSNKCSLLAALITATSDPEIVNKFFTMLGKVHVAHLINRVCLIHLNILLLHSVIRPTTKIPASMLSVVKLTCQLFSKSQQ